MKLSRAFVILMAAGALAACDEDEDDPINLAGVYVVSEFRYTADSGAPSVDLASIPAAQGGPYGILSMTVASDNSFTGTLKLPTAGGPQTFPAGGQITLDGDDQITIDFDAATDALGILDDFEVGTYSFVSNTLTITLPNVTFNYAPFGGANADVESNLRIVGSRTSS